MTRPSLSKTLAALSVLAVAVPVQAALSVGSTAYTYAQSFDSLATSGASNVWANNATLPGWSLFTAGGAAITTYATANDNTGAFKSFGNGADRALGGTGSGGAYFGSPASGAIAGYIVLAFTNNTGVALDGFTLNFDGEQWRNGGNASAQAMVLEYGFGNTYATTTFAAAPAGFTWSSPITGATAAVLDGNLAANRVAGVGGTLNTSWASGGTLWLRWVERNDVGNDHNLAIDNLSFSVVAAPIPEPGSYALMLAGLSAVGFLARRRRSR